MIAALCFDDLAGVRVLIDFNLAGFARARFRRGVRSASTGLRIKQVDHVFQAVAVFCGQIALLRFEFDFFLRPD